MEKKLESMSLSHLIKMHDRDVLCTGWAVCGCRIAQLIREKYSEKRAHNDFWDHW